MLVSNEKATTTLDRYVDHIEHFVGVAGIDHVGIGFDFFEFIYKSLSQAQQAAMNKLTTIQFIPDLTNHSHSANVTRKLIERGWGDADIEKVLWRNWMRLLAQTLN